MLCCELPLCPFQMGRHVMRFRGGLGAGRAGWDSDPLAAAGPRGLKHGACSCCVRCCHSWELCTSQPLSSSSAEGLPQAPCSVPVSVSPQMQTTLACVVSEAGWEAEMGPGNAVPSSWPGERESRQATSVSGNATLLGVGPPPSSRVPAPSSPDFQGD